MKEAIEAESYVNKFFWFKNLIFYSFFSNDRNLVESQLIYLIYIVPGRGLYI